MKKKLLVFPLTYSNREIVLYKKYMKEYTLTAAVVWNQTDLRFIRNKLINTKEIFITEEYEKALAKCDAVLFLDDENMNISISKKGGHVIYMNTNREVNAEILSQEEATQKGKEFLENKGFSNMQETYYITQEGITTINYAYMQDDVIAYPDLIKVKVALDNGDILGIETTGYLNNHTERDIHNIQITSEEAKENLNPKLELTSERLAIIPTEWQTEILCYEFKGNVDDKEFLVYINADTLQEEKIYILLNTPGGTMAI